VAPETAVAMATAPHRLWEGALELWLALARWSAPLCTLGAAPERCGDGGGARTRTRAGDGAVVGAGALEGAAPRSVGAAPELCGDDGDGSGGARTRTGAGDGAVVGAGALEGAAPHSGGGAGAVWRRRRRQRRAHPHRGGAGAVDGAGALAEDGAGGRRALTGTALAPEQAARDSHARTHARTHTPPPHTQLLLLAPLVQLAA
jgi:hypothetical protein